MTTIEKRPETPDFSQWRVPAVDIFEDQDGFLLLADLPGVPDNQVDVRYERGQLTLEARRPAAPAGRRIVGDAEPAGYRRSFSVPGTIDVSGIKAELKAGVLNLRLPKSEAARPREIPVING